MVRRHPGILGRSSRADGRLTIVGVRLPGSGSVDGTDAFTPLIVDPANPSATGSRAFQCYGRLAPGVTLDAARAELSVIAATLARQHRFDEGFGVLIDDLHESLVRDARPGLRLLMGVVAAVLAIGCANLAGLLLARGVSRRGEFAVRAALGATRGRLVRQLVVESLVLSAGGGLAGLAFALLGDARSRVVDRRRAVVRIASQSAGCQVSGLHVRGVDCDRGRLRRGAGAAGGSRQPRSGAAGRAAAPPAIGASIETRQLLVVSEVALAVVLLVGAGLLLRTLSSLGRVSLGFQPARTLTMGFVPGRGARPRRESTPSIRFRSRRSGARGGGGGTIQSCRSGVWLVERVSGARKRQERGIPREPNQPSAGWSAAGTSPRWASRFSKGGCSIAAIGSRHLACWS